MRNPPNGRTAAVSTNSAHRRTKTQRSEFQQPAGNGDAFRRDVLAGLSRSPKRLPSKYFYDRRGCALFDRICELDEYYLTRTELAIMRCYADEMSRQIGPGCTLVEYGSGSSIKTRILLDRLRNLAAYVPVDIAREHLLKTAHRLAEAYPRLPIRPVCADFTSPFALPAEVPPENRRVIYFPGSTIGNLEVADAVRLLQSMTLVAGPHGGLLIGIDLKKSPDRLEAAYNDKQGVTAAFNLNLIQRVNRELEGTFQLDRFHHHAPYNARDGRIEMHLVSHEDQAVSVGPRRFEFAAGESICTEYSHKYSVDEFSQLAARGGWSLHRTWTDAENLFAVLYLANQSQWRAPE